MKEYLFIFLYGVLTLTGVFLSVFWGRLAARRWRRVEPPRYCDRYFIISAMLTADAVGTVILFGSRFAGNIHFGLSRIAYGWEGFFIVMGLLIILGGKVFMVWLADLENERTKWVYGMGLVTLAWGLICLWLARFVWS